MDERNPSDNQDVTDNQLLKIDATTPLTRRRLFRTGAKVGLALAAFIPAAAVLLKNPPAAEAYVICSVTKCVGAGIRQYEDCWTGSYEYACVDSRQTNEICSCAGNCCDCTGYHC